MKLFIGCSSSNDISKRYLNDCEEYLEELFKLDNDLVFGAYNKGLMAIAYKLAKKSATSYASKLYGKRQIGRIL